MFTQTTRICLCKRSQADPNASFRLRRLAHIISRHCHPPWYIYLAPSTSWLPQLELIYTWRWLRTSS